MHVKETEKFVINVLFLVNVEIEVMISTSPLYTIKSLKSNHSHSHVH